MRTIKFIAFALFSLSYIGAMANVNDTIVVNKPDKVTVITTGNRQTIIINGKDGNPDYQYQKEVDLGKESVERTSEKGELDLSELFSFNSDQTEIERIINKYRHEEGFDVFTNAKGLKMQSNSNSIPGVEFDEAFLSKLEKAYLVKLNSCSKSVRKRFAKEVLSVKGFKKISPKFPSHYDSDLRKGIGKMVCFLGAPSEFSMSEFVTYVNSDAIKGVDGDIMLIYIIGKDLKYDEICKNLKIEFK